MTALRSMLLGVRQQRSVRIAAKRKTKPMHTELMVLIDESDVCTKEKALHFIALHLAHQQAMARGLYCHTQPQAYAEYVFPRCDEIEAKLRRIIAIGPP